MNQLPKITQEQKDAVLIYKTIVNSYQTENVFTAHKFYQLFVKRDEFLARRQAGHALAFTAPRFTVEYIYLRLLELSQLGFCQLAANQINCYSKNKKPNDGMFYPKAGDYYQHTLGMCPVDIAADGTLPDKLHTPDGNTYDSIAYEPIVPMEYAYSQPNAVKSVMDIEKALPVMCFVFDLGNPQVKDSFGVSSSPQPIIITIKNTTDTLQQIQLFRKQKLPAGVEIGGGIPDVSIEDMLYEIRHEKYNVEFITQHVIRQGGMEPHEAYYAYIKNSEMNGNIAARPLCMTMKDFQAQSHILTCDTGFVLDYKTEWDMDIKPKDEIRLYLYLSKDEPVKEAVKRYSAPAVINAQRLKL